MILARVELERLDPAQNARRFYALTVMRDPQYALFPEGEAILLVLAWGRFGRRLAVLRKRFWNLDALAARWRAVLALRKRHGYVITREEPTS